jgi:hypothetical protein
MNTPETDAAEFPCMTWPSQEHPMVVKADYARQLERERNEARDAAQKAKAYKRVLKETNAQLKRERDEARGQRDELRRWTSVNGVIDLQCQRDEARGQRDRLAEALRKLADCDWVITLPDRMDAVREIANEALQALNQTTEP